MCAKSKPEPTLKTPQRGKVGIPTLLQTIRHEKLSEVVSVKVQYSLRIYLQQRHNPVSTWVRADILEKLRREAQ